MIRVKRISILIALLLPLLTSNAGFACCGGGGSKEFIDQEGKSGLQTPFEESMVIAKSGDLRVEALADKSGEYELILPPGKYEVWVERLGVKVSRSDEVVTLKDRDSNQKYLAVQLN